MPMTTTITSTAPITIATVALTPRNVAGRSTMRSVRSVRVSTWVFVDGAAGCAGCTLESPWGAGRAGLSCAGVVVVSAGAGGAARSPAPGEGGARRGPAARGPVLARGAARGAPRGVRARARARLVGGQLDVPGDPQAQRVFFSGGRPPPKGARRDLAQLRAAL